MTLKTIKIVYWALTIIFGLFMLMDGGAGVAKEKTGQDVMRHLGYPVYIMVITGTAKILGAIALLQNKFKTIKEWAFAGFAFNFIGAFASRAFVGDSGFLLIFPLIILMVMFILYYFWKRYLTIKPQ
ncbi:DoxX family protein [Mucilaginibacter sp. 14171R-50]|uniref:DoxX family protein n=1 Tax=Mucilaginibacter sp. 14171R-50 TaxID=2703789 RepID=UPI00138D24FE|nr:DoxX family protein [Mucilaginibacter sp. 14171R-50]QHS55010.1 DoxX family protein [Mucilaginibacter sp. 14171R-50]